MRADSLPGANVFLSVNDSALQEHGTETHNSSNAVTALAYVEAVAGAAFAVNIALDSAFQYRNGDLKIDIYMDGARMRFKCMELSNGVRSVKVDKLYEANSGQNMIRRFLFAENQTTDEQPDPSLKSKFEELGEVKVTLTMCQKVSTKPKTRLGSSHKLLGEADIPEKALKGKAISNHIKLGEVEKTNRRVHSVQTAYPYGRTPLATFIFKYRSHRDLQIEGIIIRTPSPVPLEDRDPQDLTAEEARELVRRIRGRGATEVKLENQPKQEGSIKRQRSIDLQDEDGEDSVTIVSVNPATRGKRTKLGKPPGMEILDLTGD